MATNGSFTTTSCEGRSLTFNWSVKSQNVANNQTTINWSLVGSGSYTYGWVTCGNFKVTIDGKQVYYSATRLNVYSGTTVASGTYTFTHDNSGNKSFTAYAEAGIYYVAVNCSGSGTWSLPSIARNATITNAPNFNDEANPTITYTNPAGTNVSSLQACISLTGSSSDVPYRDISKTGTSYTFNLTTAERNTLRQATTGKSRTVYFYIKTIINGTTLYSSYGVTFSIVNGNPTIGTVTYQDSNATTVAITGNNQQIIQNQSALQLNIGTVTALKYATISKVQYSINGYTVDITNSYTNPVAIGTINYSTNFNLNVIVTDSRGFVTTKSITVTMLAWKLPYATINIARQSNFYAETDMLVNAYFSSVDSHNSVTIQYKYRKTSDSTYSSPVTIANNTQVTASFDNQYDYDFQFIITDLFGSTTYNVVLPKGIPLVFFDRNLNSVGINCFPVNPNQGEINGSPIIESGSNTNGDYIKYYDGTMICTKKVSFNNTFTTAWGSMYTTDLINLGNWSAEFSSVPVVNASIMSGYSAFIQAIDSTSKTQVGTTYLARPVNTNAQGTISIIGIGKWK